MSRVALWSERESSVDTIGATQVQILWQCSICSTLVLALVGCMSPNDADTNVESMAQANGGLARSEIDGVLDATASRTPGRAPVDAEAFVEISAGGYHNCVRKRNGNVYCWGRDDSGQVGMLPTANCYSSPNQCVDRPKRVSNSSFGSASTVDAGFDHTCAIDLQGKGYCWGNSSSGQLGNGTYGYQASPVAVSDARSFTSISAGTYTSCATTSGDLLCWGNGFTGSSGAFGRGSTPQSVYSPTGLAPVGVSAGYLHLCAQWVSGSYRETNCWGGDSYGQTGVPAASYSALGQGPTSVGTAVSRVTTQYYFTCVDRPDPSPNVQCFGYNYYGQLGNGNFTNTSDPQTVGGLSAQGTPLLSLRGVSTGINHACALDASGNAYCWGNGYWGQLGNGIANVSNVPVLVTGGLTFKAIAAGYLHTCAIGTDNALYCWGSNYNGQLGTQYKSPNQPYTNGWVSSPVQALTPTD